MTTKKGYKSFGAALARLEEITARLESGETPLEESITLYTEGVEIAGFCSQKLSEAEKKITILKKLGDKLVEVPFEKDGQETNEGGKDDTD
ncbi:MAG: exodeoxyribonuclease VII small subunit [candidate division Zixibacteria bacterium]|nr:exodeoxyribonuclease VII small subunit [candidate division Zixibacteria bacterium]